MDSPDNRSRSGSDISRTRSLSTSLATQESLNNMSSKFGGRTPVRIYFLDNSSKMFLLEPTSTALDVIKMILQKLDVTTHLNIISQYFSLYESLNGATIDSPIDFEVRVSDVISRWIDDNGSKLVFMIRLFVPSIWGFQFKDVIASRLGLTKDTLTLQAHLEAAEIIDSQLLHLQYNQCVYNVITGQYPTTPELALELGVYHFIYKFGAFDETRHHLGFLSNRIVEFLPFSHLRGSNVDEWEQKLLNNVKEIQSSHSALTGKRNFDPQRRYVETVMLRLSAFYGCAFFRCSQTQFTTLPSDLYVAIHRQGIYLVEKSRSRQILRQFHLQELNRWGYKSGILFYFEAKLDGKELSTVEFGTRDGLYMAYLLTDYVHAFLQEAELEKSRGIVPNNDSNTNISSQNNNINHSNGGNNNHQNNNTQNNNNQNNNLTSTQKMIPPVIVKSQSLSSQPPPPPPPRPKSIAIKSQSSSDSTQSIQYTPYHHQCATIIQSNYRGFALRNEWIREDSAILIQAVYRGYAERCRVSLMLEELFHSGQLEILDEDDDGVNGDYDNNYQ